MKISVITVTYQSVGTLEEAMRSVLRQSWPDVEYIVVDGGSTDGTVETIRRMEPEFNGRLRWVSEPD
ncbi:MAG: glycosyltransferase, partial [Bacteroidales bacterium]|nr:glycosyltransferase [Bacteroidales bacterium]